MDIDKSTIEELFKQYRKFKFEELLGNAALDKFIGGDNNDRRKESEILDIAMKKKMLGMDFGDDLDDRKPLVPTGLERQGLISVLGSISKMSPASSQSARQATEMFGKLPPNNLVQLGIKTIGKEAKSNAYPLKRAASILSIFGF